MKKGKISQKDIQKALEKDRKRSEGRVANNLEQDAAMERLKAKLTQPSTMAVLRRMKDR